ncbi:hypothetical protein P389DRAFT_100396 [Cystobasidium minutum MCA 4210]|uniref:uncharacterized protein n=1 Tax=Cystobasidium minutum MCA 4210 TaxID=1397322 RepID=UPI0034D017AC|eukprot:jgi/Rhomi1/100396/CE100395_2080
MFAGLFSSNTAKEIASSKQSPQRRLSTTATSNPPVIIRKPPFPQPLPHTKVRVACTTDGIVLSGSRGKAITLSSRAILLPYSKIAPASLIEDYDSSEDSKVASCTAYGCLGILRLFHESYLLLITSKKRVGDYAENPSKRIYCLSGVSAIPLFDPASAREAVEKVKIAQQKKSKQSGSSTSTSSSEPSDASTSDSGSDSSQGDVTVDLANSLQASVASITKDPEQLDQAITEGTTGSDQDKKIDALEKAEDRSTAVQAKARKPAATYGLGRFFWSSKARVEEGDSSKLVDWAEGATPPTTPASVDADVTVKAIAKDQAASISPDSSKTKKTQAETENLKALDKKILRELVIELTSGGFFFSQDFDLTTCMQAKWQTLQDSIGAAKPASARRDQHQSSSKHSHPHHGHKSTVDIRGEEPRASEPLAHRADRRFWYNRWLSRDLLDTGVRYSSLSVHDPS